MCSRWGAFRGKRSAQGSETKPLPVQNQTRDTPGQCRSSEDASSGLSRTAPTMPFIDQPDWLDQYNSPECAKARKHLQQELAGWRRSTGDRTPPFSNAR